MIISKIHINLYKLMDFVHCKHNPINSYYSYPIKMNFIYNKKKNSSYLFRININVTLFDLRNQLNQMNCWINVTLFDQCWVSLFINPWWWMCWVHQHTTSKIWYSENHVFNICMIKLDEEITSLTLPWSCLYLIGVFNLGWCWCKILLNLI